ncbi:unnamed protein product [Protopolystoma xenopodis]|uniref:Uncharacterized protein n=1 Tax=Protopolystoma xenopodis TaxID=117903 RepID=A0A3S5B6H2_9PLAT|nr:unnamed protein product [Protopolystoma xenopodis]
MRLSRPLLLFSAHLEPDRARIVHAPLPAEWVQVEAGARRRGSGLAPIYRGSGPVHCLLWPLPFQMVLTKLCCLSSYLL